MSENWIDPREGFLTPNQEKGTDDLIEVGGVAEIFDGPAIRITDNIGLQKIKAKIPNQEVTLPIVYGVVDEIFRGFGIEP